MSGRCTVVSMPGDRRTIQFLSEWNYSEVNFGTHSKAVKSKEVVIVKLPERMNAFKKDFENTAPKQTIETMHRATEALRSTGILDRTVKVGDKAPEFTLKNTKGEEISLAQLLSKGPIVLGFYRGRW